MDLRCTVTGFLDSMGKSHNVEICTGATAWDNPEGATIILIFGQGLWFGDKMPDKSLINPNQCRSFGVSFCDDPTDPHRALGIYNPVSNTNIPMVMRESFAYLMTRCPTKEELDYCLKTYSSDKLQCDPTAPLNIPVVHSHNNSNISMEIDRCLASISTVYDSQRNNNLGQQLSQEVNISRMHSHFRNAKKNDRKLKKNPSDKVYPHSPPQPFPKERELFTQIKGIIHQDRRTWRESEI